MSIFHHPWIEKIEARSGREKALLLITLIVIIYLVINGLVFHSLKNTIDNNEQAVIALQAENQSIQAAVLKLEKNHKPIIPGIDDKLQSVNNQVIPEANIPLILENLMTHLKGLTFVSLDTLSSSHAYLFSQKYTLSLKGTYEDLLNYLEIVEKLEYPVFWQNLEYKLPPASTEANITIEFELYGRRASP